MPNSITPMPAATDAPASTRRTVSGRSRLAVVGVAAAAALADWAILSPLAGLTLEARQGGVQHIGAISVVVATLVVAFAGWGLLAILERRTQRRVGWARDTWTVVATIVCVLSLGSPLTNGIGLGAKLGLASLHLIVGATVIIGLRRTALAAERC
ncbi:DUF6069 family protein [Kribbella kalugense]|uniref:Uncharacterized protein n=1 Tax=Kribbella kalugense TaxID=2512221 RepID=A0A4R7ZXI3_9ACTN|nr:DUF6069 family protein [Kribbella kalugense]TDW21628.1 hypothetical protein EV650_0456 [Kribbella kalugense]